MDHQHKVYSLLATIDPKDVLSVTHPLAGLFKVDPPHTRELSVLSYIAKATFLPVKDPVARWHETLLILPVYEEVNFVP